MRLLCRSRLMKLPPDASPASSKAVPARAENEHPFATKSWSPASANSLAKRAVPSQRHSAHPPWDHLSATMRDMRRASSSAVATLLAVDPAASAPLYRQLYDRVR